MRHLTGNQSNSQSVSIEDKWCFSMPTRTYQTYRATPPTFLRRSRLLPESVESLAFLNRNK